MSEINPHQERVNPIKPAGTVRNITFCYFLLFLHFLTVLSRNPIKSAGNLPDKTDEK